MVRSLMRSAVAIVMALVAAFVLVILVEVVTLWLHPFPAGMDTKDSAQMKAHVGMFPDWVLAIAVAGWPGLTFVSAWIATRFGVARHPAHGIVVGGLLFAMASLNLYLLPYPIWFEAACLVLLPLATYLAVRSAVERVQPEV